MMQYKDRSSVIIYSSAKNILYNGNEKFFRDEQSKEIIK